jgi:hypothetical protein
MPRDLTNIPEPLHELFSREVEDSQEQRSKGWFDGRKENLTGSEQKHVIKWSKGGFEAPSTRLDYLVRNCQEGITGLIEDIDPYGKNEFLKWGRDTEPLAIEFLEEFMGVKIYETGAIKMPWSDRVCISPDGVAVDLDGNVFCVEVKCRTSKNQLKMMIGSSPKIPTGSYGYDAQIYAEIEATGADYCIFLAFDPRLPTHAGNALVIRVDREPDTWNGPDGLKKWNLLALKQQDKYMVNIKKNSAEIAF